MEKCRRLQQKERCVIELFAPNCTPVPSCSQHCLSPAFSRACESGEQSEGIYIC